MPCEEVTASEEEPEGVRYDRLPEILREGARLWIEEGIHPGSFLTAVIENDLTEAFSRADDTNLERMHDIVRWWYNEAPSLCWGNKKKATKWAKAKRQ